MVGSPSLYHLLPDGHLGHLVSQSRRRMNGSGMVTRVLYLILAGRIPSYTICSEISSTSSLSISVSQWVLVKCIALPPFLREIGSFDISFHVSLTIRNCLWLVLAFVLYGCTVEEIPGPLFTID